jgi:hypothetical protein
MRISSKLVCDTVQVMSQPRISQSYSKPLNVTEEDRKKVPEEKRHQAALEESKRAKEIDAARKRPSQREYMYQCFCCIVLDTEPSGLRLRTVFNNSLWGADRDADSV